MATKTNRELSESDRARIGEARDVLKSYGQYVDVAEMSDVAFEKRVCRMKALDIAVNTTGPTVSTDVIDRAKMIERYIWEGERGSV